MFPKTGLPLREVTERASGNLCFALVIFQFLDFVSMNRGFIFDEIKKRSSSMFAFSEKVPSSSTSTPRKTKKSYSDDSISSSFKIPESEITSRIEFKCTKFTCDLIKVFFKSKLSTD